MSEHEPIDFYQLLQGPGMRSATGPEVLKLLQELGAHRADLALRDQALRRAKADLEDVHQRYLEVYELAPIGYATLDTEGRVLMANVMMSDLVEVERHRLVGTMFAEHLSTRSRRSFAEFLEKVARHVGPPSTLEVELRRASSYFTALLTVSSSRDQSIRIAITDLTNLKRAQADTGADDLGAEAKLVGVTTDISERKRRVAELDESLARFRQIADHLDDAIYVAEADTGKTLYASPAFETIFGRSTDEVQAERWPCLAWIDQEDRERVNVAADCLREGKSLFDVQYRVVRPDGSLRTVRNRAFLIPEHNRLTGIIHDMTAELSLQAELRQAQRLEAIGTLASGVAHDFNNLLMGVGGCVQLALRRLDPAHDAHAYIRRARDAILRGASLTRQILRFSDTRSTTDEPVELDTVVTGARALIHSLVGEHIALSLISGAPGLLVAADAGDLEQVLLNLASNARDAMPDGGRLTFRTEPHQGGMVALSVRDTGVGMGEETKRRVFEPFFTTKEVGKGTGLGLSTVFAVVRRMGGSVDIDSTRGQGTTFTLYLPVVIPDPSVRPSELEAGAQGQGQTILVVDDDPLVRMTVETYAESLGYRALTASSVTDALKVYTENPRPIDVVLTDIMMPGLLGSDLNRIFQKSAPDVSVIFMSAHPWQDLVRQGQLKENARLLAKPFDAKDLGLVLHHALKDKPPRAEPTRLRIFVVDDNQDVVNALRDLLEMEGHAVTTALSSADALRMIPEFVPDIVLCDLNVDEVSGLEIVSRLHRDERLSHTVFLAVTGVAPHQSRSAALAAGFHDVLVKPLDFHELSGLLVSRVRH